MYEIEASSVEDADDAWGNDGPELATAGRVEQVDASEITPVLCSSPDDPTD